MPFPSPPWSMRGQLYLSIFRVGGHTIDGEDRNGITGVAFVDYEPGSELTYSELLVARPVQRDGGRHVTIDQIWVDSPASLEGGRSLWAIPKDLCTFRSASGGVGLLRRTQWEAYVDGPAGTSIAHATFRDLSPLALRTPFSGSTWQRHADGPQVVAELKGSARSMPCLGSWDFAGDGPLAWLRGRRPLMSFRMADFRMSFG